MQPETKHLTFEDFANDVISVDSTAQIDPALLLALVELLKTLLPILLEQCKREPKDIPALATQYMNNAPFVKFGFRRLVRRTAPELWHKLGRTNLADTIVSTAYSMTAANFDAMYASLSDD